MKNMRCWLVALCAALMLLANGCGTDTKAETASSTTNVVESNGKEDKSEENGTSKSAESSPQIEVESTYTVDIDENMEGTF